VFRPAGLNRSAGRGVTPEPHAIPEGDGSMTPIRMLTATFALAALPLAAAAQNAATVAVDEGGGFGPHLVDGDGRPLYLFTTDTQGEGDDMAEISCGGECLDAWPLFTTEGEPMAGEGAETQLLGTVMHEGEMVVTYNGWPLYYFVQDQGADAPQGQDIQSFGGEWYLVTPEGTELHAG
jgi:predicted lipoprotein with Yx(FWY)xxD motif